jgi:hypothetical protein
MANKTIDQLASANLADFSEATELETQVTDLTAPTSRKATLPQSRFIHLDLAQLALEVAATVTDPTAALMLIVDPILADSAASRNVRAMHVSEVQKLMATRSKSRVMQTAAKVGTTAGWVVGAANNLGKLATIPASQTASTLVIPVTGLALGDIITAFYLNGSIQSAGNAGTLTCDLRVLTAAAAGATDASLGAQAAPLSVTANTILSVANTGKSAVGGFAAHTVVDGESYYILVTSTTGVSVTEELQNAVLVVTGA